MQLVADVGSTDTKLALFASGERRPLDVARLSTDDAAEGAPIRDMADRLFGERGRRSVDRIVLGSVSPSRTMAVRSALAGVVPGAAVVELTEFDGLPLHPGPDGYPEGVGPDRIANALAALEIAGGDAIVVDAGTATTVDCVSTEGVFVGGAIAPGLAAGGAWLRGRAAHLPTVPLARPSTAIGRRTEDALQSGLFYSAVGGVEGLVRSIRGEWQRPDAVVLVTGGYAALLASHSPTFGRIERDLTLIGLAVAGEALSA